VAGHETEVRAFVAKPTENGAENGYQYTEAGEVETDRAFDEFLDDRFLMFGP